MMVLPISTRLEGSKNGDSGHQQLSSQRYGSHGLFQRLGGTEGDLLAGLDFDRFTSRRVAAHACGTLADLQDTQITNADARPLFQMLRDGDYHLFEHR